MAEGKEVQRKCVHCGKRFVVVRHGRGSLPRVCPRCVDALERERAAQRAADARLTPTQRRKQRQLDRPTPIRAHWVQVKPVSQRFAAKGDRVGFVWWDLQARMYRGVVHQIPEGRARGWPTYNMVKDYPAIHEVWATSISDLVHQMSRYADISEQVQHELLRDTPVRLRDQMPQAAHGDGPEQL